MDLQMGARPLATGGVTCARPTQRGVSGSRRNSLVFGVTECYNS